MTDPKILRQTMLDERFRCLQIHKLCRDSAVPSLFRDLVKRGVNTDEASTEIEHLLAHRGR